MIVRGETEDAGDVLARALDANPLAPFDKVFGLVCFRPPSGGVCQNCVSDEKPDAEGVMLTIRRCRAEVR